MLPANPTGPSAEAGMWQEAGTLPTPSDAAVSDAEVSDADARAPTTHAPRPGFPDLCTRAGADPVRDAFCGDEPAQIIGLRELQAALQMNVVSPSLDDATAAKVKIDPSVLTDQLVVLGHSTALAGRVVSPINPRVLLLGQRTIMAFQRGIQQVELAAFDREVNRLNMYLLTFRQACNDKSTGCTPGDVYTPQLEHDWVSVELHDDEDLKNTPSDCRQCHQRGLKTPLLLMRELRGPWTHFFGVDGNAQSQPTSGLSGADLVRDFDAAKAGEIYAGVPGLVMGHTAGFTLENRVTVAQPLEFNAPDIDTELASIVPDAGTARRSATWDAAYQAFKRGEQLALPYFEVRPTDPVKQAALTLAYQRYKAKEISADQLPDLSDIFPDDPQTRAEIGLQTEPGATAPQALIQACTPCHNDVLDPTITRARFSVALSRMSRDELDLAITRIEQAPGSTGVMPPPDVRQLDARARSLVLDYLRQTTRSADDDAMLNRAASVGMAKDPYAGMR